ncbi:Transcription factor CPC [Rhynchospora pubera]|uniref:Transcription factor CPC n=1 Tax=Rhynchospora pubera TaxID=906938 RepID=A0AAV8F861_9POAL|nr:Transcription factor CPC [Rhynchospora pubera]KAJ4806516.1 Transcription factor CPC [Rhynchospora pubera]
MSSSNPSSSLANSIKKSVAKPPLSSPTEAKKVPRPDGSSRPLTSSGKPATTSSSASRPEKPRPQVQGKEGSGLKEKPTSGTPSAPRLEKPKQPVPSVKRGEPGSKGKEVVRSPVVKSSISTPSSRPVNAATKSDMKNKTPVSTSKTDSKSTKTTKRTVTRGKTEKKVYSLPGQKHDPPEEREPLRIFYESLWNQIPTSEMAEFWMMEHGLLSPERAKKAFEKKQRKPHQLRTGTPVKSAVKLERPESSKKIQSINNGDSKAKKRVDYSDDDDFIISRIKRTKV